MLIPRAPVRVPGRGVPDPVEARPAPTILAHRGARNPSFCTYLLPHLTPRLAGLLRVCRRPSAVVTGEQSAPGGGTRRRSSRGQGGGGTSPAGPAVPGFSLYNHSRGWRTYGAEKSVAQPERRRADDGLRPGEGLPGRRAQADRPDGHQGRLRDGRLWRLQRHPRRRARALVRQEDAGTSPTTPTC